MSSSRDHAPPITGGDGALPVPSHTPGPWRMESGYHQHRFVRVIAQNGHAIHYKYGTAGEKEADQDKANARLITAAPYLLRALQMCVIERSEWLEEARAAIANATGDGLGRAPSPPVNADEIPGNTP